MTAPQPGIFITGLQAQHHIELRLRGPVSAPALAQASAQALHQAREHGVTAVIGYSGAAWQMLTGDTAPVADFVPLAGPDGWRAPSTQADVWLWLQGEQRDVVHDAAMAVARAFVRLGDLTVDVPAFVRAGNRDLTGFVDGTENPESYEARQAAACIPSGEKGAGGSIALTQIWRHDLAGFHALPLPVQEQVIGRTREDDIELDDDRMPADSHVSRTDVKLDGVAMEIYRRSAPFGTAAEGGLCFVAFACEQIRMDIQLKRMFGMTDDGLHDRLIEFSSAVTGSYWYVPDSQSLAGALGT